MNKVAMITGASGQDGSILVDKLLAKEYLVIGIDRWSPLGTSPNLIEAVKNPNFIMETGDITEKEFMYRMITKYKPDYLYNMAAISLVPESFKIPHVVFETNCIAVLNMLEIIKTYSPETRFLQASTSEQMGDNTSLPQNTDSLMLPNSPYAISKLASFFLTRMYRKVFGLSTINSMTFNHEGTRRGEIFVTRKITRHISSQFKGNKEPLQIGNMDAFRDWGEAGDFCDAFILMMESDKPDDYTVCTGESHSVREFIEAAYAFIGKKITWKGTGKDEKGYDQNGNLIVEVNEKFYRPVEVPYLHGDHSKITEKLSWKPTVTFHRLVDIMMEHDLK